MKKLFVAGIVVVGLTGFAAADSIAADTVRDSDASRNGLFSIFFNAGAETFYDASRMSNLAEGLRRAAQGDEIKITPSNIDMVARRMLGFTTEYTVVRSADQNDPLLAIQVKPHGSKTIRTLNFEDWKQFILNDRGVNFEPKRL